MFWRNHKKGTELLQKPPSKIEVFSRHCLFSSISAHKKRPLGFSREKCYRNLKATVDETRAHLTFFLDLGSAQSKGSKLGHYLNNESNVIQITAGSEAASFLALLDHVEKLSFHPETILYFVEDDYLHREGWIDVLLEGFQIPGVDYVTLYDHSDKYSPLYSNLQSEIFATATCHWRTIPSTTHTFAVRYATLIDHLPIHRRYSQGRTISADHQKFCRLGRKGATLISPMPGWSTHAEPEFASPCIDWTTYLQEF